MDNVPASIPAAVATVFLRSAEDEDIPLGWECANPALQIESWGADEAASAGAAAGLVIES